MTPLAFTLREIVRLCSEHFDVPVERMLSTNRRRTTVIARHAALHIARELTKASTPKIAEAFGSIDHTQVLHAVRRNRERMIADPHHAAKVIAIAECVPLPTQTMCCPTCSGSGRVVLGDLPPPDLFPEPTVINAAA